MKQMKPRCALKLALVGVTVPICYVGLMMLLLTNVNCATDSGVARLRAERASMEGMGGSGFNEPSMGSAKGLQMPWNRKLNSGPNYEYNVEYPPERPPFVRTNACVK